jgi:hypothetical protein
VDELFIAINNASILSAKAALGMGHPDWTSNEGSGIGKENL